MAEEQPRREYRLLLLGGQNTGRRTIARKIVGDNSAFQDQHSLPQSAIVDTEIQGLKCHIYVTVSDYKPSADLVLQNHAILVVLDMSNRESLQKAVKAWKNVQKADSRIMIPIVIANKTDLKRQISDELARDFAMYMRQSPGIGFMPTAAISGKGVHYLVEECILAIANSIYRDEIPKDLIRPLKRWRTTDFMPELDWTGSELPKDTFLRKQKSRPPFPAPN